MIYSQQIAWMEARFRHFNVDRCAALFHEEQPPEGQHFRRRDGVNFPAVVFKNAVTWYPCRDQRPVHRDGQSLVKSDAPANVRPLLYDTLDPDELIIVEGEGHLLACISVGLHGVITAGGTGALGGRSAAAFTNRALLRGKSIRIVFDPDEYGRHAAPRLKAALETAGATRVAIVDLRQGGCSPDDDVEDWLNSFDTPEAGYNALRELLTSVEWGATGTVDQGAEDDVPIQEKRFTREGDPIPTLAVMVWDESASLAIYGPTALEPEEDDEPEDSPHPNDSVEHDEETVDPDEPRSWHVADTFRFSGNTYVPDMRGDVALWLEAESLVLPPPPFEGPDSSAKLWADLTAYYRRWFAVEDHYYDVMAAYCFLTYRLVDAGFDHVGFLRFVGPPSSGKNRALDVMRFTCWKAYTAQPTAANLHRVTSYFGNFTLVIDEFHPARGRTDSQVKDLVDLLNLSFQKSATLVRMDRTADGNMVPNLYRVFGPKIFASYDADEDEAFARRAVVIPTGVVDPTDAMIKPQLPPEAKIEAQALRARLLAWRGRKLSAGLPALDSPAWVRLLEVAGAETSQVFWPLLEMVPASHTTAQDNLVKLAKIRKDATHEARFATQESYLLDSFAEAWERGDFHKVPGGWFISTKDLTDALDDDHSMTVAKVGGMLKRLGLEHCTRRYTHGGQEYQRKGFLITPEVDRIMGQAGIPWPRPNGADSEFTEAAL